jgi:NADH-quinone oxidoreductase subunit G
MACAADVDDLGVITPTGERCRFSIDTDTLHDDERSGVVIRTLVRQVL